MASGDSDRNEDLVAQLNAGGIVGPDGQAIPDACPECGSSELETMLRSRTVQIEGTIDSVVIDNEECTRCTSCAHEFQTFAQSMISNQIEGMLAKAQDQVKASREAPGVVASSEIEEPKLSESAIKEAEANILDDNKPRTGPTAGPFAAARHLASMKEDQTFLDRRLPLREAKRIVAEKSAEDARAFLDAYEPGENPVTRVMVWDSRVIVCGHSSNKAACVAITTAVQTAAAIGRSLRCVAKVERYDTEKGEPVYDVQFVHGQRARRVIAGLLASFAGVARTAEGDKPGSALTVCDQRTILVAH